MKYLIVFFVCFNVEAMTCQEARTKIQELKNKEVKTPTELSEFKQAVMKLASCWGN